jgi:hypothetical protein
MKKMTTAQPNELTYNHSAANISGGQHFADSANVETTT